MSQRVWSQVEEVIEMVMFGKKSPYEYKPPEGPGITPVCPAEFIARPV
jgi:hypothetical protein